MTALLACGALRVAVIVFDSFLISVSDSLSSFVHLIDREGTSGETGSSGEEEEEDEDEDDDDILDEESEEEIGCILCKGLGHTSARCPLLSSDIPPPPGTTAPKKR